MTNKMSKRIPCPPFVSASSVVMLFFAVVLFAVALVATHPSAQSTVPPAALNVLQQIKAADKEYETTWETWKVKAKANGQEIEAEGKTLSSIGCAADDARSRESLAGDNGSDACRVDRRNAGAVGGCCMGCGSGRDER